MGGAGSVMWRCLGECPRARRPWTACGCGGAAAAPRLGGARDSRRQRAGIRARGAAVRRVGSGGAVVGFGACAGFGRLLGGFRLVCLGRAGRLGAPLSPVAHQGVGKHEEAAHHRHQRHAPLFAARLQAVVQGLHVGVPAARRHRRHVQQLPHRGAAAPDRAPAAPLFGEPEGQRAYRRVGKAESALPASAAETRPAPASPAGPRRATTRPTTDRRECQWIWSLMARPCWSRAATVGRGW